MWLTKTRITSGTLLGRVPQNSNKFLPTQGFGLELRAELGQRIDNLNYQRYSIDSFINKSFKGFIVYSRFTLLLFL